jgi:hemerythrin-like domain-containing protein
MEFDRMIAELFQEEAAARDMARKLIEIGEQRPEDAAGERASLVAFLKGAMERHMAFEETVIFPKLGRRGFDDEVEVALSHHGAVRDLCAKLEGLADDHADLASTIAKTGRLLLQHTNFESDYLYPELTHEEWRELMEETIH